MKLRAAARLVTAVALVAGAGLAGFNHAWWTALALTVGVLLIGRAGTGTLQATARDQDVEATAKTLHERLARARGAPDDRPGATRQMNVTGGSARNGSRAFLTPWYMAVKTDGDARWSVFFRDELPDELWRRLAHEVTALRD